MAENIFSKVKESASAFKEKVSDLKEDIWGDEQKLIIQEFKDSGTAKIKEVLEISEDHLRFFCNQDTN